MPGGRPTSNCRGGYKDAADNDFLLLPFTHYGGEGLEMIYLHNYRFKDDPGIQNIVPLAEGWCSFVIQDILIKWSPRR